jgi:radical SAM superfamily enzyme YgiQ (UPF0313 family)
MIQQTKTIKIVLIAIEDFASLAIRTLHSVLDKEGHDVTSIFLSEVSVTPTDEEMEKLLSLLKKIKPDIIGIRVLSNFFPIVSEISKKIKEKLNCLIIWGGVHPTLNPEQSLEYADIVCIGEGEKAILELVSKLSKNEDISKIKNLWIKKDGKIIKNEIRPLIQDLDSLPFPDFSNKNKIYITFKKVYVYKPDYDIYTHSYIYPIMTSRGCPFSCTYCVNSCLRKIYAGKGKYVRRRSVENVIKELVNVKRKFKSIKFIVFNDDVFTFDKEWIKEFCEKYKKYVNIPFYCYIHPKIIDEEVAKLLKGVRWYGAVTGIQSGSERVRKNIFNRYESNEEIVNCAWLLHKYKISSSYDIIQNPFETDEDKRETLNLLLSLPKPFRVRIFNLLFYPNYEITKFALQNGKISKKDVIGQTKEIIWQSRHYYHKKSKESMFWFCLYSMLGRRYIPNFFINWFSHNVLIRKYPNLFALFLFPLREFHYILIRRVLKSFISM